MFDIFVPRDLVGAAIDPHWESTRRSPSLDGRRGLLLHGYAGPRTLDDFRLAGWISRSAGYVIDALVAIRIKWIVGSPTTPTEAADLAAV